MQIEDKDVPILSHLMDIRVVNLRDEDVGTSDKNDEEDDEEDDEGPKVKFRPHVPVWQALQYAAGCSKCNFHAFSK